MITKILFTLSIIVGVVIYLRIRSGQMPSRSTDTPAPRSEADRMLRQGAWLFLVFMLISAAAVYFLKLGDEYSQVRVHVINTSTGESISYMAQQKDIRPNSFTTLEGRRVFLADVERMEIVPQP